MTRAKAALGLGIAMAVTLSGCGFREIVAPDGTTNREFFLGAAQDIQCGEIPGHSARVLQIGAWASVSNAGAGYHQARYFCGAPECQLVVWADGADAAELERIAATYSGICFANKKGTL